MSKHVYVVRRDYERRNSLAQYSKEHDMAKYLYTYSGGNGMPESEAEQAQVMAAWGAWFEDLGAAIVDGGAPTAQASTVLSDGTVQAGGGANPITGYSVVAATSLDDAVSKAQGCPVRSAGGSIAVAELLDM